MDPLTIISIIGLALSAVSMAQQSSALSEAKAKQEAASAEAKQIAEKNATLSEQEAAEQARKDLKRTESEEAMNRAAAAASGLAYDEKDPSSIALSLAKQKDENKTQRDFASYAAKSRADIIRQGGTLAEQQGLAAASKTGAEATAAGINAGGAFAKAGKEAYDWWNKPTGTTIKGGGVYSDVWAMGSGV